MNARNCSVLLILLAGCGQTAIEKTEEPTPTIIITNNGSGGQNGDGDGDQPRTNGGDDGDDTPIGENNGGNNGATQEDCGYAERLVNGACLPVDGYLSLGASVTHSQNPQGEYRQTSYFACYMQRTGATAGEAQSNVLAEDEHCRVFQTQSNPTSEPQFVAARVDLGAVSFSGSGGTVAMEYIDSDCLQPTVQQFEGLFQPGETVSVDISGGADFASYSAQITVPEEIWLEASPYNPGSEVYFGWNPTGGEEVVVMLQTQNAAGDGTYVSCTVPDTGEFMISAELTQHLQTDANYVGYTLMRLDRRTEFVDDVMIDVGGNSMFVRSEFR